ncbi:ElyC/SanA/YdcF family protein [Cytophaga sp. FL35]|uniref:SanA/YdcF family protein n=1 Tax=Cytophaga sp. FL35 TaxID=1904456 RepID=UPI001653BA53|nr:ElyC/SanA/YdcF family protein [Cytophaga sp. FL35]MBC6997107.1 YdcF family protein [Cytophaga sp. FL35]
MKRKHFKIIGLLLATLLFTIFLCNLIITNTTEGKTFNQTSKIFKNRVGLVLGTSKKLIGGLPNPYYTYRIKATVELFKADKIEYVLVSGDNGTRYYNEPNTIKKDLVDAGIPEEKIYLDFAGFRTLDSMVRAKEVFGLDSVTVISQEFHNQRAIYLAEKKGLNAIGFNAKTVMGNQGLKVQLREYLARVKVFVDLIFNTQPKFYGDYVEIK